MKRPGTAGGSSLLLMASVLCAAVFALLCLSAAAGDTRLNEQSLAAVTGYYAADAAAEETLALLRQGVVPAGVTAENGVYRYFCPISETQTLAVEVRVTGADYEILRWQSVGTGQWQPDGHLNVRRSPENAETGA